MPTEEELRAEALKERVALGETGNLARVGKTFFDPRRGVDVFAGEGEYFEELEGGGVRVIQGQMPTNIPSDSFSGKPVGASSPTDKPTGIESLAIKGAEGKKIKRSGTTLFNSTTGTDVHAQPGNIIVEYTDGTYEERPAGQVQTPTEAKQVATAGPTAQELGIDRRTEVKAQDGSIARAPQTAAQALAQAQTAEAKEEVIAQEGLKPTRELELLGRSYQQLDAQGRPTGVRRYAKEGYVFYQDPDSDAILERPLSQAEFAQPTTSPSVLAEREAELVAEKKAPAVDLDSLLGQYGISLNPTQLQTDPIASVQDLFSNFLDKAGVGDIREARQLYEQEIKELDDQYAKDVREANENPWVGEALRARKVAAIKEEYDLKRSQLTARANLALEFDKAALAQGQWVVEQTLRQYNLDRQLAFDQQKQLLATANAAFDNKIKLATLEMTREQRQESIRQFEAKYALDQARYQLEVFRANKLSGSPYAGIRSVQGGLYDLSTGKFIVPPSPSLNEQSLESAFGQYVQANPGLSREELATQAASAGLDPGGKFVTNVIDTFQGKQGVLTSIRKLLGF